ncbi:MAG: hypothetical protein ISR69_13880 [Gammaproteobacteria bacterium]|nr:hypothetical protein [Gammaproteobacteria bacterium]
MKIVLGKIKNLLATLLLCISFNANSAVILEITGDTNGVLNSNHHSIDASSATLNSNYGPNPCIEISKSKKALVV